MRAFRDYSLTGRILQDRRLLSLFVFFKLHGPYFRLSQILWALRPFIFNCLSMRCFLVEHVSYIMFR